jgi:hypothetical protein
MTTWARVRLQEQPGPPAQRPQPTKPSTPRPVDRPERGVPGPERNPGGGKSPRERPQPGDQRSNPGE